MKVLMVEPGKVPYVTEIKDDLKSLQEAVGGQIEVIYPWQESVALICNEDGKIDGLPLNRALYDADGKMYDIIAGNFFIAGLGEEDFTELPSELAKKFYEQFKHPEVFTQTARGIKVTQQLFPKRPGRSV